MDDDINKEAKLKVRADLLVKQYHNEVCKISCNFYFSMV